MAGKKRLQSFRSNQTQAQPGQTANAQPKHTRSHSRTNSVSSQLPKATSEPTNLSNAPRSRPNSHRRNSSVSNRRESAELMGLAVPAEEEVEDPSDAVRRALLALEGKHAQRTPKVQIPDLDAVARNDRPDSRKPFALNSSLAGKRDSFGKLLAPASLNKIDLGTLIEEEEEEEENIAPPPLKPSPVVTSSKPRPQNLNLRPLSMTTQTLIAQSLPSPSATPSPRITGLRSLTLAASPVVTRSPSPAGLPVRRPNVITPVTPKSGGRKTSISYKRSPKQECVSTPVLKTSLSRTGLGILTPEPTPTSASLPEASPDLSPSRRAFIYQTHSALVSRVADLENLLASRPPPSPALSVNNDEFLSLIADLKAERDDLKRGVQDWRTRVTDLEKQAAILASRVETERKEAWVVKEQLGVLEIEKAGIEQEGEQLKATITQLNRQVEALQRELEDARRERDDARRELAAATTPKLDAVARLQSFKFGGNKPLKGLGFQSIDSLSSTTDVEDVTMSQRSSLAAGFTFQKLKVVQEEESYDGYRDDGAHELAHYEDEDDEESFYSHSRTNSEVSAHPAFMPFAQTPPLNIASRSPSPAPSRSRSPSPSHERKSSLTKAWTFPAGAAPKAPKVAEVDRFFLCLEDVPDPVDDDSSIDDREEIEDVTLTRPQLGFGFGHGFDFGNPADDEDDIPPFVLPAQPGQVKQLDVVVEDEEDDSMPPFLFPTSKAAPPLQFAFPVQQQAVQFPRRRW